jgi:hypothetical protein
MESLYQHRLCQIAVIALEIDDDYKNMREALSTLVSLDLLRTTFMRYLIWFVGETRQISFLQHKTFELRKYCQYPSYPK